MRLLTLICHPDLGAASGTSVSHVADLVGPTGTVYAVEFSHRSGRDLINMASKRPNVIPIVEEYVDGHPSLLGHTSRSVCFFFANWS